MEIGFVPEAIVRGAFLSAWIFQHPDEVKTIVEPIKRILDAA